MNTITVNNSVLGVLYRVNEQAKRLRLRFDPHNQKVIITVPRLSLVPKAWAFLKDSHEWLERRLQRSYTVVPFTAGSTLPIFGHSYMIHYQPDIRQKIVLQCNRLHVAHWREEDLPVLIEEWMQRYSHQVLGGWIKEYAQQIDVEPRQIRTRELKSRWGSCTKNGDISLSWRLVFAPTAVAQYICAHEVAHLREMNHSPQFWRIVESLCPQFQQNRRWLRLYGAKLFCYGPLLKLS